MVGIILIIIISLVVAVLLTLEIIGLIRDIKKRKSGKNKNKVYDSNGNNDNKD